MAAPGSVGGDGRTSQHASARATATGLLVSMGVIVRAHGLRGEVRVKPWNDASTLLGTVNRVSLLAPDGTSREVKARARKTTDAWLVTLEGVSERDGADALRGVEIAVPRASLPPIDPDEVYLVDLIGLEVWDGDSALGIVDGVFEYPSVDCLQVTGADGVRELPMLDAYVVRVDRERGRIEAKCTDELPVEPVRPGRTR